MTERQYNRAYQKRLLRNSSEWVEPFRNVIAAQYKAVAKDLSASTDIAAIVSPLPYLKLYYRLYLNIGMKEAMLRFNQYVKQKKNGEEILYEWGNFLRNHVETQLGNRVTKVAETTRKHIQEVIEQGLKDGEGYDKIARQLRKIAGDESLKGRINPRARALLIARTEGVNASNLGAMQAAKASGLLMEKSWLHGYNARRKNRTAHILLGREKGIPMDRPFMVNGKLMQYPGDPAGGAEECCNCKCTVTFKPVRDPLGNSMSLVFDERESMTSRLLRIAVTSTILTQVFESLFGEEVSL
ncbi:MAG TPA: phage minor head protein [Segetibacter sp.]|jgi:hypothetical protein